MKNHLALFDVIGVIAHKRYQGAERTLAAIGFNHTEARLLTLLSQRDGATQDELSAQLFVDRSNAGRSLKRLEADGYVTRERDTDDRRTFRVYITKNGSAATRQIAKVKDVLAAELFQTMTEDEMATALRLLESVANDEFCTPRR